MIGRHPVFERYPSPYRNLAEEYQGEREWKQRKEGSHLQEIHSQTWRRPESLNYRNRPGQREAANAVRNHVCHRYVLTGISMRLLRVERTTTTNFA